MEEDMMKFGCSYYPEAWPRERWASDIRMMREAGMDTVRMGEFNWGKFERSEGVFDFSGYMDVVSEMGKNGILVMLCTPTAAPPKWMSAKYPEILKMHENGSRVNPNGRRQYCPSSRKYREFSARIVSEMAGAFKGMPNVISWQIDNEISAEEEISQPCVCPECTARFREYLRKKYGTVDELNKAWNGAFWSGDFSCWEDIKPPFIRTSWRMEYSRFMSSLYTEFVNMQRDILKKANPSWKITTNMWTTFMPDVEPSEAFAGMDFASCDVYINNDNIEFFRSFWDFYRNVKGFPQEFTVGETGAWNRVSSGADASQTLRTWMWEMIARGVDTILYFRWRQSVMGEENHPAILPWSGVPGDIYSMIKSAREEYLSLNDELSDLPLPDAEAVILHEPLSALFFKKTNDYNYFRTVVRCNSALCTFGLTADIAPVNPALNLKKYKLVILPLMMHVPAYLAEMLECYVRGGGVVLSMPKLNQLDETGKYRMETAPYGMRNLFGLGVNENSTVAKYVDFKDFAIKDIPSGARTEIRESLFGQNFGVRDYMEKIEPEGCVSPALFDTGRFSGCPLLTENNFGKGKALYMAAISDSTGITEAVRYALSISGRPTDVIFPEGTCAVRRGDIVFMMNSSEKTVRIKTALGKADVLFGEYSDDGTASLPPYGVCIIRAEKKTESGNLQ